MGREGSGRNIGEVRGGEGKTGEGRGRGGRAGGGRAPPIFYCAPVPVF